MGRPAITIAPGTRYGRLVIGERVEDAKNTTYLAACDCGNATRVQSIALRRGRTTSCGCLGRERRLAGVTKHGHTIGGELHPLYRRWLTMKSRCHNPNYPKYADYGARGIIVCERWRTSFANFLADMGMPPTLKHSLERKDNDGPYAPGNVVWATAKEQRANRRR